MRSAAVLGLVTLLTAGCGAAPTAPSSAPLAGYWTGVLTVGTCAVSGAYRDCGPFAPGTSHAVWLGITQRGRRVSGYSGIEPTTVTPAVIPRQALYRDTHHPFSTELDESGRLRAAHGWGRSPGVVTAVAWDVGSDAGRLTGTLAVTWSWYKVAGSYTATGAVSLTRETTPLRPAGRR